MENVEEMYNIGALAKLFPKVERIFTDFMISNRLEDVEIKECNKKKADIKAGRLADPAKTTRPPRTSPPPGDQATL